MTEPFFIVARERGQSGALLPTWSDRGPMPIDFDDEPEPVRRVDVPDVPGTFQLSGLLCAREARQWVEIAERLGFHADAPLQQPSYLRRNQNLNWVVSDRIVDRLWARAAPCVLETVGGARPLGLNARFRFYRYGEGDFFMRHHDVAWPGSRVVDGALLEDVDPSVRSHYTFIVALNDDFDGGATRFEVGRDGVRTVDVRTPMGSALCFPHGNHPDRCVHASTPITRGCKYIIRTDLLFGACS
ncbi:MAG: prolyl hydroxylase family protein [Nannocystaceae bacterium]|nr:2OG-Fe(II) oxygenase [bacterium]